MFFAARLVRSPGPQRMHNRLNLHHPTCKVSWAAVTTPVPVPVPRNAETGLRRLHNGINSGLSARWFASRPCSFPSFDATGEPRKASGLFTEQHPCIRCANHPHCLAHNVQRSCNLARSPQTLAWAAHPLLHRLQIAHQPEAYTSSSIAPGAPRLSDEGEARRAAVGKGLACSCLL